MEKMATNVGPQKVQSDTNTSSLSTKLNILIAINTTDKGIIIITDGKKRAKKYDTGVDDGGITRKYNDNNGEIFFKGIK